MPWRFIFTGMRTRGRLLSPFALRAASPEERQGCLGTAHVTLTLQAGQTVFRVDAGRSYHAKGWVYHKR